MLAPVASGVEKGAEQAQAGDPPHPLSGVEKPEQNHIGAVGNREVRALERLAMRFVLPEPRHDRRRWNHDQASVGHEPEKPIKVADKEPHAEDLPESFLHNGIASEPQ